MTIGHVLLLLATVVPAFALDTALVQRALAAYESRDAESIAAICHPRVMRDAKRVLLGNRSFFQTFVSRTEGAKLELPPVADIEKMSDRECFVLSVRAVISWFPKRERNLVFGVVERGDRAYAVVEETHTLGGSVSEPYPYTMLFEKVGSEWKLCSDPWLDLVIGAPARTLPKPPNKAPEPTTTSVTSPAAQEPRQP